MDSIAGYLIGIASAALISGILTSFIGKNHPHGTIIRLIAGVFITFCVISPIADVRFDDLGRYLEDLELEGEWYASNGTDSANAQMKDIIKQNTEAYILDKADAMGLNITAEVTVGDSDPPLPVGVLITGTVSSYNKQRLINLIAKDLGIPEAAQIWK